jgi:hypothetical protein
LLAGGLHQFLVFIPRFLVLVPRLCPTSLAILHQLVLPGADWRDGSSDPRFLVGKCTFCLPD